jgi:hypothetical protein
MRRPKNIYVHFFITVDRLSGTASTILDFLSEVSHMNIIISSLELLVYAKKIFSQEN